VDRFIAPSEFLRQRFVSGPFPEWGIAPERIVVLRNGIPVDPAVTTFRTCHDGRRDRFGFFGHINRFKGATVALAASAQLSRAGVAHTLSLHGGTAYQSQAVQEEFAKALAAAPEATHAGPYKRADLARRMSGVDWVVVPSVWWENAPLVISEAQLQRRPVICADIGGMAEMVADNVDGLHARVGDSSDFAGVMRRGIEEPGLWERLVANIQSPPNITDAARAHLALYADLMAAPSGLTRVLRGLCVQGAA
jgi:glycosyltransferase involved in cell wall biosynthesis